jgi:hypothetical protein
VGENTSQIEHDIITERSELGRNLEELETKARALTDWRTHYRNHPGLAIGAVFAGAMLAGVLVGRRNGSRGLVEMDMDEDGYTAELRSLRDRTPQTPAAPKTPGRTRRHVEDTWRHVSEALLGVATAKAIDYISNVIPGFRDHYQGTTGPGSSSSYGT